MKATHKAARYMIGVAFGFVGLAAAWGLLSWTVSALRPTTVADLFAHPGFSVVSAIATLAVISALGTGAMRSFDAAAAGVAAARARRAAEQHARVDASPPR